MRILRTADYERMPWKNGGGETMEIAVHPVGAGLDHFGWRLSMAKVAAGGPFSTFDGIDRTLCILDGAGIELTVGQATPMRLDRDSPPFSFPADVETHALLVSGPITDLNLMTRRGHFRHGLRRMPGRGTVALDPGRTTFLVVESGSCSVSCVARTVTLDRLDCALFEGSEERLFLDGAAETRVILGEIEAASRGLESPHWNWSCPT